mmetsp:Transcript_13766/g.41290  ORF Transcript_13766/g.41290 Transcript_13766/m.41290 type:complete len:86 (+) Transcript_13766:1699-1956(+)
MSRPAAEAVRRHLFVQAALPERHLVGEHSILGCGGLQKAHQRKRSCCKHWLLRVRAVAANRCGSFAAWLAHMSNSSYDSALARRS